MYQSNDVAFLENPLSQRIAAQFYSAFNAAIVERIVSMAPCMPRYWSTRIPLKARDTTSQHSGKSTVVFNHFESTGKRFIVTPRTKNLTQFFPVSLLMTVWP